MPSQNLWAGLLSQMMIYDETGCPHSARHAIRLLDRLCEFSDLDGEVRSLCERASDRLENRLRQPEAAADRCRALPPLRLANYRMEAEA